jgi:predicted ATPase/two-component sensor histidine kinase
VSVTDLSGLEFDLIFFDSDASLYRCRSAPLLLMASDLAPVLASELFEHQRAIAQLLEGVAGCSEVASLASWNSKPVLMWPDTGGCVLERPRSPMPIVAFLDLAITITQAVADLHARGIVHGDVRPTRIIINGDRASLFGFGRSRGPNLTRPPLVDEAQGAEGLPYRFPDQANNSSALDRRDDLYSLGVTLYELLSGKLPFSATTPLAWRHAHSARAPYPIGRWLPTVPASLAAIIMKLLSKAADDRYQTASGLIADLRTCLDLQQRSIDVPFALGSSDVRDHLVISQRLYGRQKELGRMNECLQAVRETERSAIIMLSGFSGIGKTKLVEAFSQEFDGKLGLFATGKFDQLSHSTPFSTLTEALGGILRKILEAPGEQIESWRERLRQSLGDQGRIVAALIPEISVLLPDLPAVPTLPPIENHARFQLVLTRLLQSFATRQLPLVLFLDDLQWVDAATLDLIQRIDRTDSFQSILLIGAYRENEVAPESPLIDLIARTPNIPLGPLDLAETSRLVGDSLGASPTIVEPVAKAIVEKTAGNPLFIAHLLVAAVDDGTIYFNSLKRCWSWDLAAIVEGHSGDVVALMTQRLRKLPDDTQRALSLFASIGNRVSTEVLCRALDASSAVIDKRLQKGLAVGLIYRYEDGYSFLHDRVQEAAYALIPPEHVSFVHLELARKLAKNQDQEALTESIFDLVEQYNRGRGNIESSDEIVLLAELNFVAGKKAENAAAYGNALRYYSVVVELTKSDTERWFECQISMSNCEFLSGNPDAAERRLIELSRLPIDAVSRGQIAWSRITIKTALNDFKGAIETCLAYMETQGVLWSPTPREEDMIAEFGAIATEIKRGEIPQRLLLPNVADANQEAILNVLGATLPPAFFTNKNLVCLLLSRMANLSKTHGNGSASALGYAYLGMVLGPMFKEYQAGYEFGRVALELVQRPEFARFKGRVSMTFAYHVLPYSEPLTSGRELLSQALHLAQEGGDVTYTGFSSCTMISSMLAAGDPLPASARRAEEALLLVQEIEFGLIADIVTTQLQTIRCFQGLTFSPDTLSDGLFEQQEFEERLGSTPSLALANCWHQIRKMSVSVHFGHYRPAVAAAAIAEPLLWSAEGHLELVEYHFYAGIAKARMGAPAPEIDAHINHLRILAENCPANFAAMSLILEAELALRDRTLLEALALYDQAMVAANGSGLLHVEAMAAELSAQALLRAGLSTASLSHLERSRDCYKMWGAAAKVTLLEHQYPELRSTRAVTEVTAFLNADVETVVRSSAAVTGEAVPSKMIRTFMTIALEHAGAQIGLLLLPRNGEFQVQAEAYARSEGTEVTFIRERLKRSSGFDALVTTTLMTLEPVIENRRGSGSMAMIPLIARGKAIGLLYLENNLSKDTFSPTRTSLLRLIAAQAAISLENASLDEKESLLKEVHHRVKNNLQLISSLLNLQAAKIDDSVVADLFAESRNRVRSMALVHENLYRAGDFANVAMAEHIRNLSAHLIRAYSSAERRIFIDVQAEEIDLNLDQAISSGLIINELVSNAIKHAFNDFSKAGEIAITLKRVAGDVVQLMVADNGVGISEPVTDTESMGMQLVRDLTDQLNGKLEIGIENGTQIRVTFKALRSREQEWPPRYLS